MSRKGNAWDNAVAESFFGSLKNEIVHQRRFVDQAEARSAVFAWIEGSAKRRRLYPTLDFVSPSDDEACREIRSSARPEIRRSLNSVASAFRQLGDAPAGPMIVGSWRALAHGLVLAASLVAPRFTLAQAQAQDAATAAP